MDYSNDDWWVPRHKERIAKRRRAWRDATQWKCNLSSSEARMEHITNLSPAVLQENSTKISRWYRRMNKSYFMFDWVWSQNLECSGAALKMITDDYNKKMDSEYKKFINKIDP